MITLDIGISTTPAAGVAAGAGPSAAGSEAAAPRFGDVFRQLMGQPTADAPAPIGEREESTADDEGEALLALLCPGDAVHTATPVRPLWLEDVSPAAASDPFAGAVTRDADPLIESDAVPEGSGAMPAPPDGALPMVPFLPESVPAAGSLHAQPGAETPPRTKVDLTWPPAPAAAPASPGEVVQQPPEAATPAGIEDPAALLTGSSAPGDDVPPGIGAPTDDGKAQASSVRHAASAPALVALHQEAASAPLATEAAHRAWAPAPDESQGESNEAAPAPLRTAGVSRVDILLPTPEVQGVVPAPSTTPTAQAAASAQTTHTEEDVASQMVQSMRILAADGGGEARVRLRPEYLGEVLILLKVEHGAVSASVQADSPAVRQWAENNEHVLRQGLGTHGLRLEQLTVSDAEVRPSTPERQADDSPSQPHERRQQQRPRREHAESGHERFEVVL